MCTLSPFLLPENVTHVAGGGILWQQPQGLELGVCKLGECGNCLCCVALTKKISKPLKMPLCIGLMYAEEKTHGRDKQVLKAGGKWS